MKGLRSPSMPRSPVSIEWFVGVHAFLVKRDFIGDNNEKHYSIITHVSQFLMYYTHNILSMAISDNAKSTAHLCYSVYHILCRALGTHRYTWALAMSIHIVFRSIEEKIKQLKLDSISDVSFVFCSYIAIEGPNKNRNQEKTREKRMEFATK